MNLEELEYLIQDNPYKFNCLAVIDQILMFLLSDKKVLEITEEIETWKMKDKIN